MAFMKPCKIQNNLPLRKDNADYIFRLWCGLLASIHGTDYDRITVGPTLLITEIYQRNSTLQPTPLQKHITLTCFKVNSEQRNEVSSDMWT